MNRCLLASLLLLHFHIDASSKKNNSLKHTPQNPFLEITTEIDYNKAMEADCTVIMVTAQWCPYCNNIKPLFEKIGRSMNDQNVLYAYLDIGPSFNKKSELCKKITTDHPVETNKIPSFLVFKKGVLDKQLIGSQTEDQLKKAIFS